MDIFAGIAGVLGEVGKVVDRQGGQLLSYALILAAVGTLAMAIVEMLKSIGRLQLWFHKWRVVAWTRGAKDAGHNPVLSEMILLAVGAHSNPNALYDQPVEKMMGQVQAAVNLALEYPEEYPHLYAWVTQVPKWYWERGASVRTRNDGEQWMKNIQMVNRIRALPAAASLRPKQLADAQAASKARARLNNLVARKLDAFQNQTQYEWERLNHYTATLISAAIFLAALWKPETGSMGFAQYLLLALPAGVVAPFAKQLAGSLSSFRK